MAKESKCRLPSELTDEEARVAGERLRAAREQADREDAPLLARQMQEAFAHRQPADPTLEPVLRLLADWSAIADDKMREEYYQSLEEQSDSEPHES